MSVWKGYMYPCRIYLFRVWGLGFRVCVLKGGCLFFFFFFFLGGEGGVGAGRRLVSCGLGPSRLQTVCVVFTKDNLHVQAMQLSASFNVDHTSVRYVCVF